jgi:hypothetical protein
MNRKGMRLAAATAALYGAMAGMSAWALEIQVLSSFPELVTGGDALVKITGTTAAPTVMLAGADVSAAFKADPKGGFVGLVTGLKDGDNALAARAGNDTASVTLKNHAINATLFAGPQQTPFVCENETHGLAKATDESCAAPAIVTYYYRSTNVPTPTATGGGAPPSLGTIPVPVGTWKVLDPRGPRPTDIDTTTTLDGKRVPLIIWTEKGVINRSAYVIGVLHDPAAGPLPSPTGNTTGWNGKLIMSFRGGVKAAFHQGRTIGNLDPERGWIGGENSNLHEYFIRAGYGFAGGSLMVTGTTTDHVVQAETAAKIKERFIELFGPPVFTIGTGTSGASQSQHMIQQNYPGIMDAIMPWRSYPEVLTFQQPINDCKLLINYFKMSELPWTEIQKEQVSGKVSFGYCVSQTNGFPNLDPAGNCDEAVKFAMMVDPQKWAKVRCTFQDNEVNVFGVDPKTGFARSPWDNVGVQYGLAAYNKGLITTEQFIDLNRRIGGFDIATGKFVGTRHAADPEALRIAYANGVLNTGDGGLRGVPILDVRGYTDGTCSVGPCPPRNPAEVDVHDGYHTLITRARLVKTNGNAANHVRIVAHEVNHRGPDSIVAKASVEAVALLDKWVTATQADKSNRPQPQKVAANKPAELVDACYTAADAKVTDMALCGELFPIGSDARIVAGLPLADDILKCQLKPVSAADYTGPRKPTEAQLATLRQIFPEGVCDWSKPGVGQVPLAGTWGVYSGGAQVKFLRPARPLG